MIKSTMVSIILIVGLITNCGLKNGNPLTQIQDSNTVNCDSCRTEHFIKIAQKINNVNEKDLADFFVCCCKKCSNNAEFSEFSNELLFRLLQENTILTIKVLSSTKNLDLNYIALMLENPIHDGIDLKLTIQKIESTQGYLDIRTRLLNSIKIAIAKYH